MTNWIHLLVQYLTHNKLYTLIGCYVLVALALYIFLSIDILIPCIWEKIFGVHCPGCGLTTAFIHLLYLDFQSAWHANALIFIVVPATCFYLQKDFRSFRKNLTTPS